MTVLDSLKSHAYSIKVLNEIMPASNYAINVQGTFHKEHALDYIKEAKASLKADLRTLTELEESIRRIK